MSSFHALLPLESIQSLSPGLYAAYKKTFPASISARLRYGITYVYSALLRRQVTATSCNKITFVKLGQCTEKQTELETESK